MRYRTTVNSDKAIKKHCAKHVQDPMDANSTHRNMHTQDDGQAVVDAQLKSKNCKKQESNYPRDYWSDVRHQERT